jgi:hypothetical protein
VIGEQRPEILTAKYAKYAKMDDGNWFACFTWFAVNNFADSVGFTSTEHMSSLKRGVKPSLVSFARRLPAVGGQKRGGLKPRVVPAAQPWAD